MTRFYRPPQGEGLGRRGQPGHARPSPRTFPRRSRNPHSFDPMPASPLTLADLCTRFERAQASQNAAMARAVAAHDPSSGATVLEIPGAIGIFLGEGHPLNQGLALGLGASLDDAGLLELEALLGRGWHPVVVELTPGAD